MKTSLAISVLSLASLISASRRFTFHQTPTSLKTLEDRQYDLPNAFNITVMLRDPSQANCVGASASEAYSVNLQDPEDGFGWEQIVATTSSGSMQPEFLLKGANLIHENVIASSKRVPLIWPPPLTEFGFRASGSGTYQPPDFVAVSSQDPQGKDILELRPARGSASQYFGPL